MPIRHKFENIPPNPPGFNWDPQFQTHNGILDIVPYDPEVIFIGTFNPGWPWNDADFFYGRGMYMWTIMANLFLHNANQLVDRRNPIPPDNSPSLAEIFEICRRGKMVFADLVLGTNGDIPTVISDGQESVLVNGNYTWSDYKDGRLDQMGDQYWLDDNVENIVKFIRNKPSIKQIYFTFKSGEWLVEKKNEVQAALPDVSSCSIFTPSGNGFGQNYPAPYENRAWSIAHHWVWNNMNHPNVPVNHPAYGHLDHDWLRRNGVNPDNF